MMAARCPTGRAAPGPPSLPQRFARLLPRGARPPASFTCLQLFVAWRGDRGPSMHGRSDGMLGARAASTGRSARTAPENPSGGDVAIGVVNAASSREGAASSDLATLGALFFSRRNPPPLWSLAHHGLRGARMRGARRAQAVDDAYPLVGTVTPRRRPTRPLRIAVGGSRTGCPASMLEPAALAPASAPPVGRHDRRWAGTPFTVRAALIRGARPALHRGAFTSGAARHRRDGGV